MSELLKFVAQQNAWRAVMSKPPYDLSVPADRQRVARLIDSELSPENLTCDGELSSAQVRAKFNRLIRVSRELLKLDPLVQFDEVDI
jgi:hypothetical protein